MEPEHGQLFPDDTPPNPDSKPCTACGQDAGSPVPFVYSDTSIGKSCVTCCEDPDMFNCHLCQMCCATYQEIERCPQSVIPCVYCTGKQSENGTNMCARHYKKAIDDGTIGTLDRPRLIENSRTFEFLMDCICKFNLERRKKYLLEQLARVDESLTTNYNGMENASYFHEVLTHELGMPSYFNKLYPPITRPKRRERDDDEDDDDDDDDDHDDHVDSKRMRDEDGDDDDMEM